MAANTRAPRPAEQQGPRRPRPPEFHNVPPELKRLCRWLVWRYSDSPNRRGKFSKVPYGINDKLAPYTNPRLWLPFEAAGRQYKRGNYDGIGLVLGDGLCGLDEDHCVGDSHIEAEAWGHIRHLDTYAEYSVSGTGIHCFAFGTLPSGGRKRGDHEIYSDQRFFVVTGWRVPGTPLTVESRGKELHEVHAMIFSSSSFGTPENAPASVPKPAPITQEGEGERESQAKLRISDEHVIKLILQDPAASRYWNGCPVGVNPSQADFALACKLAFYTGKDLEQMNRLFRRSGLFGRAKDHARRRDTDYVQYTLRRACEAQKKVWQPRRNQTAIRKSPGRPKCQVEPATVLELCAAGGSLRVIARKLSIGKTTAARLRDLAQASQERLCGVPKVSQNDDLECRQPETSIDSGIPWAEWKASALNRLFEEQGVTGKPGSITAATVRHGERGAEASKVE